QFQAWTYDELTRALDALREAGPLKGVVLDLRGNQGGLLIQAVHVADKFVDKGVLVSIIGASERETRRAKAPGTQPPYPMVVLVDRNTASGAEIVAAALKGLDRAVIVGSQTSGTGGVQLVYRGLTRNSAALKLTISQTFTPGNTPIHGA